MGILLNKFREVVNGVIKGFDRIVFKGMVRPIMFAAGMQSHLTHLSFKSYKNGVEPGFFEFHWSL